MKFGLAGATNNATNNVPTAAVKNRVTFAIGGARFNPGDEITQGDNGLSTGEGNSHQALVQEREAYRI
jgi:hypothetical protein